MRVHITKHEDGRRTIFVERTRRGEKPSVTAANVAPEDVRAKVQELVDAVKPAIAAA